MDGKALFPRSRDFRDLTIAGATLILDTELEPVSAEPALSQQTILMCAPDYFGIDYVINPWMEGNCGKADHALAVKQWSGLKRAIETQTAVVLIPPQPGLPDQVFTANAGMVLEEKVVVSRFRAPERRGEEPFFEEWFAKHDFKGERMAQSCENAWLQQLLPNSPSERSCSCGGRCRVYRHRRRNCPLEERMVPEVIVLVRESFFNQQD